MVDRLGVPVRDPDPVSVLEPLMVWDPVRLPVTVGVIVRLLVILGLADPVAVKDKVVVGVPVRDVEAVLLFVFERLPVLEPVPVPVPDRVPV